MQFAERVVVSTDYTDVATARRKNELVVAPFRLSLQAQRLFLYMVSLVRDDHDESTAYEFSIYELAREIGIDRNHLYQSMVAILDELERTKVVVPDPDNPNKIRRVGLIQNRQVATREGKGGKFFVDGTLELFLFRELLPYIRALQTNYTEVELRYVFRLSSSYSQKVYDIIKADAFKKGSVEYDLAELYTILQVPASLQRFQDFRRYVLEKAQIEINDKTDLRFTWKDKRQGRKIVALVFNIKKDGGGDVDFLAGSLEDSIFKRLRALKMPVTEAVESIRTWQEIDPAYIDWLLKDTQQRVKTGKIKKTPLAYIRAGIRKDFRNQTSLFSDKAEQEADRKKRAVAKAKLDRASASGAVVNDGFKGVGAALDPVLRDKLEAMRKKVEAANRG